MKVTVVLPSHQVAIAISSPEVEKSIFQRSGWTSATKVLLSACSDNSSHPRHLAKTGKATGGSDCYEVTIAVVIAVLSSRRASQPRGSIKKTMSSAWYLLSVKS